MKNFKLKDVLRTIALLCAVAGLMMCLNGCGDKNTKETEPETEPETTEATVDTTPEDTAPPATTYPVITPPTEPTPTTTPSDCNHVLGNWEVDTVSSCTTEGMRYKKCSVCEEKVELEVIPKLEHIPGNWVADGKAATCTSQGKMKQVCSQCEEVLFTIMVDKLDHDALPIEGYPATANTPGRTDRTYCTTCRDYVQDYFIIPAIGTVDYTYEVNTYNTCTITGVNNFTGTELILPDKIGNYSVVGIGDNAFVEYAIKTVYIPKTVTKIGENAFYSCAELTNITYQGSTKMWNNLQKGEGWDAMTGDYIVYCTNQSIEKK